MSGGVGRVRGPAFCEAPRVRERWKEGRVWRRAGGQATWGKGVKQPPAGALARGIGAAAADRLLYQVPPEGTMRAAAETMVDHSPGQDHLPGATVAGFGMTTRPTAGSAAAAAVGVQTAAPGTAAVEAVGCTHGGATV